MRASPNDKKSLAIVDKLIKGQFPVDVADKEGNMPISYLLHKDVPAEILCKVLEWHLNHAKFKVLEKPVQRYEVGGESFFNDLIRTNRATVKNLTLMKQ